MVTIILESSEATKAAALKAGFREVTVLIKHDPISSTAENKSRLERECFEMRPYRFLVSDTWGAMPG